MAKSKEERLAAAKAKVKKLKEATLTKGRTDRMDWRPKALIYLHPDTEIFDRRRVWFAKEIDEKDEKDKKGGGGKKGGKKKKVVNIPFNVPDDPECDPFYLLRKVLREAEDIDGDEVILVVGAGRNKTEYRKGDILNWDDYDYKKSLKPQNDVVCAAIMVEHKGKAIDSPKIETLGGAKTLGKEIRKEIEAEVDENGDEKGNPFFRPYPFRIEFDETASGTDMYSARARPSIDPEKAVEELLDQDAPDLSDEIKVEDVKVLQKLIVDSLVYDLELLEPKKSGGKSGEKSDDEVEDPPAKADEKTADPEAGVETAKTAPSDDEDDEIAKAEAALAAAKNKAIDEAEDKLAAAKKKKAKAKKAADAKAKKEAEAKAKEEADAAAKEEAEVEEDEVAKAERLLAEAKAKKEAAKKDAEKPKTTGRKKIADEAPEPPADDVKIPEGYDDPGPRPDDENIAWWPNREAGELYDICPKCERPVGEKDVKCPHKDCGVEYASGDDAF
jgi:hypothetical protein